MICTTCGKTYKRNMKAYLEHCRLCGPANRASQTSVHDQLLITCLERITSLEREVAALKRHGVRRVNVLDWLGENTKPERSYQEWFHTHPLADEWLDVGRDAPSLFAEWCADSLSTDDPPMRAFTSLKPALFCYTSEGWRQFTQTDAMVLMRALRRRFLQKLQAWAGRNPTLMQCDRSNALYFERLRRLTGHESSEDAAAGRFCAALSKHIASKSPLGIILRSPTA